MGAPRKESFRRNPDLERLLEELNGLLEPVERGLARPGDAPRMPVVLVIGAPRSGTTLLTQWLAASGRFGYPSNLMSRFWRAPAIGARIQMLLADPRYAFRDELFDLASPTDFGSELGKTRGALASNEFWYFWRRWLPIREPRPLSSAEREGLDLSELRAELAALEQAFDKPLAMKGMALMYDLGFFARALPEAFFLAVRRDPLDNAISLLRARERFSGDRATWYSARPPGHEALLALSPEEQVIGQVLATERAIEAGLASLDERRHLTLEYQDFCAAPERAWNALWRRLEPLGAGSPAQYALPARFEASRPRASGPAEESALRRALDAARASPAPG